jgi:tRNA/rRNA methyltransferase
MHHSPLANIRIVLVEPAGARNIGSIARVMKNMGLQHLMVVNPQCDVFGEESRRMAVHAADLLAGATIAPTLPEGLAGCRRAIATTCQPRSLAITLESPPVALPWLLEDGIAANSVALIFGPEDRGLDNGELSHAHRFIAIPSSAVYPSLNLAQAVGICCYELFRLVQEAEGGWQKAEGGRKESTSYGNLEESGKAGLPENFHGEGIPAEIDRLEGFYQHLERLLLEIGYLHEHTAESRMQKFRLLFNRAMPTDDEVAMLRGILSQMKWATQQKNKKESIK